MMVFRSMIIEAPIERVWAMVRSFDHVSHWNPGVSAARMENSGRASEVGAIRHLTIADGSVFRETLLAHSDLEHFYTYDILESPLAVSNYISTHRFIAITETGQTLGIWEGSFNCDRERESALDRIVGDDIYIGGMRGLNQTLKGASND